MCKKNDYGRKAITAILAVLTALFVLTLMSGGADASPVKSNVIGGNAFAAAGSPQFENQRSTSAKQTVFRLN